MAITLPDARQLSDEVLDALRLRAVQIWMAGSFSTSLASLLRPLLPVCNKRLPYLYYLGMKGNHNDRPGIGRRSRIPAGKGGGPWPSPYLTPVSCPMKFSTLSAYVPFRSGWRDPSQPPWRAFCDRFFRSVTNACPTCITSA